MEYFKRLFCKHTFTAYKTTMTDAGLGKMIIHKCTECGKEKAEFV